MKKVIFALAAVVALAACSNEETIIADKGAAIGFDTFVDNSTRAAVDPSLTTETMKEAGFGVYGFVTNNVDGSNVTAPLFTNEHIYWDNVWTYGTKQYWIDGATYDFAAIAPYGFYTVNDVDTDGVNLTFTSNGTTDLLYAQNNGVTGPGTVGFTFKHLLSKVKFTFTNGYDATNTVIAVKNIVIKDAYSVGVAQLGHNGTAVTATWNPSSDNLDLAFGNANPAAGYIAQTESQESDKALLLIPSNTTYNVDFTIELLYQNGVDDEGNPVYVKVQEYNHTVALTHNFEFGKSYNVATTINHTNIVPDGPGGEDNQQSTIEFTVTGITDWVDADSDAGVVFPENN